MTMMRKKTRTRTKSSLILFACVALLATAQGQKKQEPYAVVRGSVFQESGRSQPGAKVVLSAASIGDKAGKKLQEQVSSPQGEFAFRVLPGPGAYVLTVSLKGFVTVSKIVEIAGQEQINKTFTLVPASK
jgi:hypothetical protein